MNQFLFSKTVSKSTHSAFHNLIGKQKLIISRSMVSKIINHRWTQILRRRTS